jgi:hypothetical protein
VPVLNRIKSVAENPNKIILYLMGKGFFNWLPDELYLRMVYRCKIGRSLNLKKPASFNEKLQWLKLYDRNPLYTQLADKYEVRKYVADAIGEEYLIPLLGVYDSFDEIDFDSLPDKFVLKCTHDSGSAIICTNKSGLNIEEMRAKINKHLKRRYYYHSREWPYKNIKPRIVCEEFVSESDKPPEDFKVMCFNGKAKLIQVHQDRYSGKHTLDYYNTDWEKTSISEHMGGLPNSKTVIPRPVFLEDMISMSEKLATDQYHCRVDWLKVGNKLYFGEITFFDGSGFANFSDYDDDLMLGGWIDLPVVKNFRAAGDERIMIPGSLWSRGE